MWSCPRISSCIQIASSTRVWDWMVLLIWRNLALHWVPVLCVSPLVLGLPVVCDLSLPTGPDLPELSWWCGYVNDWQVSPNGARGWGGGHSVANPHPRQGHLCLHQTQQPVLYPCVWRERERGGGEFMCVHVYEGERRVNTLCLLYENSFPLRMLSRSKILRVGRTHRRWLSAWSSVKSWLYEWCELTRSQVSWLMHYWCLWAELPNISLVMRRGEGGEEDAQEG